MNLVGSLVSGAVVATVLWQAGSLRGGDAGLTLSYATQFVQARTWPTAHYLLTTTTTYYSLLIANCLRLLTTHYLLTTTTTHYSLRTMQALMWLFRIYTQLEVSMNDVERVEEYTHELPTEDYDGAEADPTLLLRANFGTALALWPSEGAVEFCDVRLQYASAHRPIFDGLSFKVAPRTRIGVVGRTGAGKSSLTVALFR